MPSRHSPPPHTTCRKNVAAAFRTNVINAKTTDIASSAPVRQLLGFTFVYLRAGSIYLLALTKTNSNVMMTLQFLSKMVELVKSYCHGDFNEEVRSEGRGGIAWRSPGREERGFQGK